MIEILTISTSGIPCGISEYFSHLRSASPGDLLFRCDPAWLDPKVFFAQRPSIQAYQGPQVVWLNFHAALHSRWTPERIHQLAETAPVVITYHDTGVPNSQQCVDLYSTVQAVQGTFIIHEPCVDLPDAVYLRQGIPAWQGPIQYLYGKGITDYTLPWVYWLGLNNRPLLGSVGFPFPWKNLDLLADATARAGWSLLLLAPGATSEQVEGWRQHNPWTAVVTDFLPADQVVSHLAACDATAFLYMCANTGTSGAIRQGIAARKPVLATAGCRQFRDLQDDLLGHAAIRWLDDLSPEGIADALRRVPIQRIDLAIHRLAERDSWTHQAAAYADIFRRLAS